MNKKPTIKPNQQVQNQNAEKDAVQNTQQQQQNKKRDQEQE